MRLPFLFLVLIVCFLGVSVFAKPVRDGKATKESEQASLKGKYFGQLEDAIQKNWKPPAKSDGLWTALSAKVLRDGAFLDLEVDVPSKGDYEGNIAVSKKMDALALIAVRKVNKKLPLPTALKAPLHVSINLGVDRNNHLGAVPLVNVEEKP